MPYYRRRRFQPKRAVRKKAMPIRRKAVRRKAGRIRRANKVIRNLGFGFPATKVVNMRYVAQVSLTSDTGTMGRYVFRANSCYDPDYTGTGSQPRGFDQWGSFYQSYTVIGSKIRMYCNDSNQTTNTFPFLFGVQLTTDLASVSTNYIDIVEQGREKFCIYNRNQNAKRGISKGFSMKKLFNLTNVRDNQQEHGAHWGNNPTEVAYFTVWQQPQDKASTMTNNYLIIMDFSVLMSEPVNLPAS